VEEFRRNAERGFAMHQLYSWLVTSRQSHDRGRAREKSDAELKGKVLAIVIKHRSNHPRDGSRQMYYSARVKEEFGIGVTKFERIMSDLGLTIAPLKLHRNLSKRCARSVLYRNLTNGLKLTGINQLIVGDLTELRIKNGQKWYVFVLTDVYSGRIVGLSGGSRMTAKVALKALDEFFELRGEGEYADLIHHTDGGSQYFSDLYLGRMLAAKVRISVAGNCQENGHAEQKNDTVKNRYLRYLDLSTEELFKKSLAHLKYLVNEERTMDSRLKLTPAEFERKMLELPEAQRLVVNMYDFSEHVA
jgi:putative transposase